MNKLPSIKKIINSFTRMIVFILASAILNCNKNPLKVEHEESDSSEVKGIYVIRQEPDKSYELYYTDYDSIRLEKIEGCGYQNIEFIPNHPMYINEENDLLISASQNRLFFINTLSNKKIGEVSVPNTTNPEHYIGYGTVQLYPCYWNSNYCILVNRSVYLINLKSLRLEKVIWDCDSNDKLTYIHDDALSDDGRILYLSLAFVGMWNYGEYLKNEIRQRLSKLDLKTGQISTIYDYPVEETPGSKFIFSCSDYIMSYDPNRNFIIRFQVSSQTSIDTIMVNQFYYYESYSNGDHCIVQNINTGSFYNLYGDRKELELYMQFSFHTSIDRPGIYGTTYRRLKGGDVYACIPYTSDEKCFVVNLSQQEVVRKFKRNSIVSIILKKD